MLVEVARLNRPLAIYPLPPDLRPVHWRRHLKRGIEDMARRLFGEERAGALLRPLGLGRKRDLAALHRTLYAMNRAVRLGAPYAPSAAADLDDEMAQIVSRLRKRISILRSEVHPEILSSAACRGIQADHGKIPLDLHSRVDRCAVMSRRAQKVLGCETRPRRALHDNGPL